MKTITLDKSTLLCAYRAGNADQKEILEHLFGRDVFAPNWREITSYEKACEVLGIEPRKFKEIGDRPQYMRMANAMLCLNSEEKAEFVGKQFFELCCACYGVTPKID